MNLKEPRKIKVGKLNIIDFQPGNYLYIGSAQRGFEARITRHLRKNKKLFWHIDYLLNEAEIKEIWIKEGEKIECETADRIKNCLPFSFYPIKGFGSSDCKCSSHLFYFPGRLADLGNLRKKLNFKKLEINEKF
ncbi:GIY-YIG nuclease family protein [Candidatus Aminicenantes bacterium AC-708-M15]|nr:GIY-YIG nuclease family protein [Candidatus Aminicenantes bacterium AC-708-M15]